MIDIMTFVVAGRTRKAETCIKWRYLGSYLKWQVSLPASLPSLAPF